MSMTRREMLQKCAAGFGNLALLSLFSEQGSTSDAISQPSAPPVPHFAPKAKRIIFLFMFGGPVSSQAPSGQGRWQAESYS